MFLQDRHVTDKMDQINENNLWKQELYHSLYLFIYAPKLDNNLNKLLLTPL